MMKFIAPKKDTITSENGILFDTPGRNLITIKHHDKSNRHLKIIQWMKHVKAEEIANDNYANYILQNAHGDSAKKVPFPYLVTAHMMRLVYVEVCHLNIF